MLVKANATRFVKTPEASIDKYLDCHPAEIVSLFLRILSYAGPDQTRKNG